MKEVVSVRGCSIKCCGNNERTIDTTSCVYTCDVGQQPCVFAVLFAKELEDELVKGLHLGKEVTQDVTREELKQRFESAIDTIEDKLPCQYCLWMEECVKNLSGLRLGKHERRVLLSAPPSDAEAAIIEPDGETRAADEANRRAIRKLFNAGLLFTSYKEVETETRRIARTDTGLKVWTGENIKRIYRKRSVWLSPLGEAIVRRLADRLKAGKPIRWSNHQAPLLEACKRDPIELLPAFEDDVEILVGMYKHLAGLYGLLQNESAYSKAKGRSLAAGKVLNAVRKAKE